MDQSDNHLLGQVENISYKKCLATNKKFYVIRKD